jgi:hypothetical protein
MPFLLAPRLLPTDGLQGGKELIMKKLLAITAAAALLAIPGVLQAYVITFDNLPGPNGDPYIGSSEGGFTITPTAGSWFQGTGYGNPPPSIFAGPIFQPVDSTIQITFDLGVFDFDGLDYSSNNAASRYQIEGFLNGNLVFDQSGSLLASLPPGFGFSHLDSENSGVLMDTLTIEVFPGSGTTSINLDNIDLSVHGQVPEDGATLLLLVIGLAGVFFWRKARIISAQ